MNTINSEAPLIRPESFLNIYRFRQRSRMPSTVLSQRPPRQESFLGAFDLPKPLSQPLASFAKSIY